MSVIRPGRASTRSGLIRLGIASVFGIAMTLSYVPAAHAQVTCVEDACDGNAWQQARGAANEISYWGMTPGHNCTNYVAWKLSTNGIAEPHTHPGNAADWATNAALDGDVVDDLPAVGSVAQWDAMAGGYGPTGHVAYVEQVNVDGTILVSEDYWHDGDQRGPLTFRTLASDTVSHFIHYGDLSHLLRAVSLGPVAWTELSTGIFAAPSALTTVNMGGPTPDVIYSEGNLLYDVKADSIGWHTTATKVPSTSRTLSAVNMGGQWPEVMSVDNDTLYLNVGTESGWQRMSTGIEVTGEIAAVDLGGLWPTVLVSEGGLLHRVWGDMDGWHAESTGLEMWGPISAVNVGGGRLEVYSVESGMLFRAWADAEGWHKESTGVEASGGISVVDMGETAHVVLAQYGTVYDIYEDTSGWHKVSTGVASGEYVSATNMGGSAPYLIQAG